MEPQEIADELADLAESIDDHVSKTEIYSGIMNLRRRVLEDIS